MSNSDNTVKRETLGSWLSQIFSGEPKDTDELIDLLRNSENRNLLDNEAVVMMEGVIQVAEMQVREIMIPKVQMKTVNITSTSKEILETVVESGHSRFPVLSDDSDKVEGILLAKDLLAYFARKDEEEFDIKDMMRTAMFIPESKRLNLLLRDFRTTKNHMAIVIDEYSHIAGLVTIEDVIEEIIGEIEDEHDYEDEANIVSHDEGRFIVNALTPIQEFNETFGTELSDEEYDTIGGLIINSIGHLPKRGEEIEFENFKIKIMRADKRRIHLLRVKRADDETELTIIDSTDT